MKNVEEELLKEKPIDKIDKNLPNIFGFLGEKNWKLADALIDNMKMDGDPAKKEMAAGFAQLSDFLKKMAAGKELRAPIKYIDTLIIDDDLEGLIPVMDEEDRSKLKEDIKRNGIITPLIVQEVSQGLLLIDGYARYRIAEELELTKLPVIAINGALDPKMAALTINCQRRHMTKEQRNAIIRQMPTPKAGRPKKGAKIDTNEIKELRGECMPAVTLSPAKVAEQLGISERTIQRVRKDKDTAPKSRKPKRICTPPDKEPESIAPLKLSDENKTNVEWFPARAQDIFRKQGYFKGIGYGMKFSKDQINYDWLVRNTENCMNDLLRAIQKAGLEGEVDHYEMLVTFEARKKVEK